MQLTNEKLKDRGARMVRAHHFRGMKRTSDNLMMIPLVPLHTFSYVALVLLGTSPGHAGNRLFTGRSRNALSRYGQCPRCHRYVSSKSSLIG